MTSPGRDEEEPIGANASSCSATHRRVGPRIVAEKRGHADARLRLKDDSGRRVDTVAAPEADHVSGGAAPGGGG